MCTVIIVLLGYVFKNGNVARNLIYVISFSQATVSLLFYIHVCVSFRLHCVCGCVRYLLLWNLR